MTKVEIMLALYYRLGLTKDELLQLCTTILETETKIIETLNEKSI